MAFTSNRSSDILLNHKTKNMQFLQEMNIVIPWSELVSIIDASYPVITHKLWWRPRIPTLLKLKMYFLSLRYNLSDVQTEESIYDRASFQYFMDINILDKNIPDATTLCDFRLHLDAHNLWTQILEVINHTLKQHNLIMEGWRLIDATIIKAPSSTKNEKHERDWEMTSTYKNGNYYFWAKVHSATDTNGIIHDIQVTTAKTHDSQAYNDLISANTTYTIGDSAYLWASIQQSAKDHNIKHVHMNKKVRGQRTLSISQKLQNILIAMPRKIVEFPFWVIKHIRWHRKTKYKWLHKLRSMRLALSWLCNIYRCRYKLLQAMICV